MSPRAPYATVSLAAALGLLLAPAACRAAEAGAQEPPAVTVVGTEYPLRAMHLGLREFESRHPGTEVKSISLKYGATVNAAAALHLPAGTADLAVLYDPDAVKDPFFNPNVERSVSLMNEVMGLEGLGVHLLGCHATAVVVHPENPLAEIDEATLRRILLKETTSWRDLGQADEPIVRVTDHNSWVMIRRMTSPKSPPYLEVKGTGEEMERRMAEDRWAVAFLRFRESLRASGLKILAVRPAGADRAVPLTDETVLAGRYPYQQRLVLLVRPGAGPAALALADGLRGKRVTDTLAGTFQFIVPGARPPEAASDERVWPEPRDEEARLAVSGAAAVLPTELLSRYFLMTGRAHHLVYETSILEALAKDGRLKLVDRSHMEKVLAERALRGWGSGEAPGGPVVAADVFLLSHVVTEAYRPYLRIQAVHGATGAVLGEMTARIDPADPAGFDPPLAKRVARWWPGVLRRLAAARDRPVWTLRDVYAGRHEQYDLAARLRAGLAEGLQADQRVFFGDSAALGQAQQEVLMSIMGLARPEGLFTPAADYLLEGRLAGEGELALRVLSGRRLGPIAETVVRGETGEALAAAARQWVGELAATPPVRPADGDEAQPPRADWARDQARLELGKARDLAKEYAALVKETESTRVVLESEPHGRTLSAPSPEHVKRLGALADRIYAHHFRATQLDPAWEEAAYELAAWCCEAAFRSAKTLEIAERSAAACQRYVDNFPRSPRHPKMLIEAIQMYGFLAAATGTGRDGDYHQTPRAADRQWLSGVYVRRRAELYREYVLRYRDTLPQKGLYPRAAEGLVSRVDDVVMGYLSALARSLVETGAAEAEADQAASDWHRLFGDAPQKAPHADFLRLRVLALRKDRAAYLDLLARVQKRWPDPRDPHWKGLRAALIAETCELFEVGSEHNAFQQWVLGRRGPGDLPYAGYDPQKESPYKNEAKHIPPERDLDGPRGAGS